MAASLEPTAPATRSHDRGHDNKNKVNHWTHPWGGQPPGARGAVGQHDRPLRGAALTRGGGVSQGHIGQDVDHRLVDLRSEPIGRLRDAREISERRRSREILRNTWRSTQDMEKYSCRRVQMLRRVQILRHVEIPRHVQIRRTWRNTK